MAANSVRVPILRDASATSSRSLLRMLAMFVSKRFVARDGDAVHAPALAVIVVERAVLRAAVVPDGERIRFPTEPAGELRLHRVRHEKVEDRLGLGAGKSVERLSVVADVECLAAGLRMRAH